MNKHETSERGNYAKPTDAGGCPEEAPEEGPEPRSHELHGMTCSSRKSARSLLNERVCALRRQADDLEILSEQLPQVLSREADQALWRILCGSRIL